jgi:hypothetical protein
MSDETNTIPPNPTMPAMFTRTQGKSTVPFAQLSYPGGDCDRGGYMGYYNQYWQHETRKRQLSEGVQSVPQVEAIAPRQPGRDPLSRVNGKAQAPPKRENLMKDIHMPINTTNPGAPNLVGPEIAK